ncbi:type VI secretion system contractile sheath small subunit [Massilia genomosp. 1]|nr:type VI secretion system contractile sheath small subunit [Massilia genomosp. 1]
MSDIENGQHWLSRNRPPRVQITYDVEIGDAVEKKELPLVVGILSDLDGVKGKIVGEQTFENIDNDNFDEMLKTISPSVTFTLPASTHLPEHPAAQALEATFTFQKFDDFNPVALLKMNKDTADLFEERQRLRDMLARLDGNVRLGDSLDKAFKAAPGATEGSSGAAAPDTAA